MGEVILFAKTSYLIDYDEKTEYFSFFDVNLSSAIWALRDSSQYYSIAVVQ